MEPRNVSNMLAMFRRNMGTMECRNAECRQLVLSVVEQMSAERDELIKKQEHLHSLAKLAEKTVSDADGVAAQIKQDAEEEAQKILGETKTKAISEAENEVSAMRANAESELQGALKSQEAKLRAQVKELAAHLYAQVLNEAEEGKRRIESLEIQLEHVSCGTLTSEQIARLKLVSEAIPSDKSPKANYKPGESAPGRANAERTEAETEGESDDSQDRVEVDILPPRDKDAMEGIRKYLEMQDEIGAARIVHLTDKSLIQVDLLRPVDVAERLSRLHEVEHLRTLKDGARTKIEVVLSVVSQIEKDRNALNVKANRITSRIPQGAKLAGTIEKATD